MARRPRTKITEYHKTKTMCMLAVGLKQKDIAEELGLQPHHIAGIIREFQEKTKRVGILPLIRSYIGVAEPKKERRPEPKQPGPMSCSNCRFLSGDDECRAEPPSTDEDFKAVWPSITRPKEYWCASHQMKMET